MWTYSDKKIRNKFYTVNVGEELEVQNNETIVEQDQHGNFIVNTQRACFVCKKVPGLPRQDWAWEAAGACANKLFLMALAPPGYGGPAIYRPVVVLDFPLYPGKRWHFGTGSGCTGETRTCEVSGFESIVVNGHPLDCVIVSMNDRIRYWFSPHVGLVKVESSESVWTLDHYTLAP